MGSLIGLILFGFGVFYGDTNYFVASGIFFLVDEVRWSRKKENRE